MIDTETFRPAIILDLDGTLLQGNSFTRFTVWLVRRSLSRMRFKIALTVLWNVILRKLRFITHVEVKTEIMHLAGLILKEDDYEDFIRSISLRFRPEITYLILKARKISFPICLATAAPKEYSSVLGRMLNLDAVVATTTPPKGMEMKECRGDVKREAVEEVCSYRGWRPALTFTDHHDDIPLMLWTAICGGKNVLISPSRSTGAKILKTGIPAVNLGNPQFINDL